MITLDWKTKLSDHVCCRLLYGVHCQICEEDLKRANTPVVAQGKIEYRASASFQDSISIINLKFCTFEIHKKGILPDSSVVTKFPSGHTAWAMRVNNQDNIREAESQGYSGPDAVWKSLVEHEYLHSLISELLYDRPSLVLETESGRKFHPSWLRYQEEAVVIGVQYLLNSDHKLVLDRESVARKTYDLVSREADLNLDLNHISDLLSRCKQAIQALWSQIEKDS